MGDTALDTRAPGRSIVVLCGVAGAGKTTVGRLVAARLSVPFADADDFHAPEAVAQMARGIPLTDRDRAPWLARLSAVLHRWQEAGTGGVLACSALRRAYRTQLTSGVPVLRSVLLTASKATLEARLRHRPAHFFPPRCSTASAPRSKRRACPPSPPTASILHRPPRRW